MKFRTSLISSTLFFMSNGFSLTDPSIMQSDMKGDFLTPIMDFHSFNQESASIINNECSVKLHVFKHYMSAFKEGWDIDRERGGNIQTILED